MRGPRLTALAGIGAALLANYWVLEGWLGESSDFGASWISDLAARTEATGWRFVALGVLSGLAIAAFALLLLAAVPRRPAGTPWLRRGLWALFATGLLSALAAAAPLSCGEELEPACRSSHDLLDLLHSLATGGEIVATVLAFALIALGLLSTAPTPRGLSPRGLQSSRGRALGWATLGIGVGWGVLALLTGVAYFGDGLDAAGGALQRADQVLLGIWLALLGLAAAAPPGRRSH